MKRIPKNTKRRKSQHFIQLIILAAGVMAGLAACREAGVPPDQRSVILRAGYGTTYKLTVQLPVGYDAAKAGGYPVILYTDAHYMRKGVVDAAKRSGLDQNSLLVGIGYENGNEREKDFTPTVTGKSGTGQASRFVAFMENELLPNLRQNYAVSDDPGEYTYCGHSLGGLLGAYILFTKPCLFGNYVLISPSLMWDGQAIFRIESQNRTTLQPLAARVFLAAGTQETGGFHATQQHLAGLFSTYYTQVQVRTAAYRNADHSGVIAPGLADGLKFISQP